MKEHNSNCICKIRKKFINWNGGDEKQITSVIHEHNNGNLKIPTYLDAKGGIIRLPMQRNRSPKQPYSNFEGDRPL